MFPFPLGTVFKWPVSDCNRLGFAFWSLPPGSPGNSEKNP